MDNTEIREGFALQPNHRARLEILVEECQEHQAQTFGISVDELRTVPGAEKPADYDDAALLVFAFLWRPADTITALDLNNGDPGAPRHIASIANAVAAQVEDSRQRLEGGETFAGAEALRALEVNVPG